MTKAFIFLYSLLLISTASAQVGSTADALGGAGIGAAQPIESAILNPAALNQLHDYNLDMQYFRRNYQDADHLDQFSFIVSDSGPEAVFPGALVYRQRRFNIQGANVKEHLGHLGVAIPITKTFAFGLSGYYLQTNLDSGVDYHQSNGDASLYWQLSNDLSLGLIAKSVFGSKDVAFRETQFVPGFGVGLQYTVMEIIRLRGDVSQQTEANPNGRRVHNAGLEFILENDFYLRTGLKNDDYRSETFYTMGLGWKGPRLKIAYAYQDETGDGHGSAHTVDIWMNL